LAAVLGHMTIRRLFKGVRERRAAAEVAAAAGAPTPGGDAGGA